MCKSYFNEVDFKRGKAFSQLTLMFQFFFQINIITNQFTEILEDSQKNFKSESSTF